MSEGRRKRPLIVPIFIPHLGCPHRCIFCQQEKITTRKARPMDATAVRQILEEAIRSPRLRDVSEAEVAFYGGTFTGLPDEKVAELLGAVTPYIEKGFFHSIRVSTRPDALREETIDLMRRSSVSTVELGVQSMDDQVLELSGRGHTGEDTVSAVGLLRSHGFKVGIQLMPGLPGDTEAGFMATVHRVIGLHPDMVRLYPTLVVRGTELERRYREGTYRPLLLHEAVRICRESCVLFEEKGIQVIRMGLMSSPSLLEDGEILAGPWHKAFGFLVRSEMYRKRIEPLLPGQGRAERLRLRVFWRDIPLARGYENSGLRDMGEKTGARIVEVRSDPTLSRGEIGVDIL